MRAGYGRFEGNRYSSGARLAFGAQQTLSASAQTTSNDSLFTGT